MSLEVGGKSDQIDMAEDFASLLRAYRHVKLEREGYREALHAALGQLHTKCQEVTRLREWLNELIASACKLTPRGQVV